MNESILLEEMLKDPVEFDRRGQAYQLLQDYFHGLSVDTLRPLLSHSHDSVRRSAVFIASELGVQAQQLINDIAPLVHDPDPRIAWDAMESVMVCSTGANANYFSTIVHQLDSHHDPLRRLAMRLIAKATTEQLKNAAMQLVKTNTDDTLHTRALAILNNVDAMKSEDINGMLNSSDRLWRYYGAIAANKVVDARPELLEYASASQDPDVSRFALEAIKNLARFK